MNLTTLKKWNLTQANQFVGVAIALGALVGLFLLIKQLAQLNVSLVQFYANLGLVGLLAALLFQVLFGGIYREPDVAQTAEEARRRIQKRREQELEQKKAARKVLLMLAFSLLGGLVFWIISLVMNWLVSLPVLNVHGGDNSLMQLMLGFKINPYLGSYLTYFGLFPIAFLAYWIALKYPPVGQNKKRYYLLTAGFLLVSGICFWLYYAMQ